MSSENEGFDMTLAEWAIIWGLVVVIALLMLPKLWQCFAFAINLVFQGS